MGVSSSVRLGALGPGRVGRVVCWSSPSSVAGADLVQLVPSAYFFSIPLGPGRALLDAGDTKKFASEVPKVPRLLS